MEAIDSTHTGHHEEEQGTHHLNPPQQEEEVVQVTALQHVGLCWRAWQATVDVAVVVGVEPGVGGSEADDDGGA